MPTPLPVHMSTRLNRPSSFSGSYKAGLYSSILDDPAGDRQVHYMPHGSELGVLVGNLVSLKSKSPTNAGLFSLRSISLIERGASASPVRFRARVKNVSGSFVKLSVGPNGLAPLQA